MTETVPERIARRNAERMERRKRRQQERDAAAAKRTADVQQLAKTITQRPLERFSEEQLLAELLRRRPPQEGPRRVDFAPGVKVSTIGIGKDHTASIYMFEDDLKELPDNVVS